MANEVTRSTLSIKDARRLAVVRAGLLRPDLIGLTGRATGRGRRAIAAAHEVIRHFGYLQLDTVSIAGARSHTVVLLSRLAGFDPTLAEELLAAESPLFEYWGHEASWMPLELYPLFEFRRRRFKKNPYWIDAWRGNQKVARALLERIEKDGPLRSLEMNGRGSRGWWDLKLERKLASILWCSGELAIRERRNFQRSFDLTERVIPEHHRSSAVSLDEALPALLLLALDGHGWARTGTLAKTWRLSNMKRPIESALERLIEQGEVVACDLETNDRRRIAGWIRTGDLELAHRLRRLRPHGDSGVLLSPFDPLLWDRDRVRLLFGFDQVLEIFKPAPQRIYGYYCLPVLAGDRLVARFDLKADRKRGQLRVLSRRFEGTGTTKPANVDDGEAARTALARYAAALGLEAIG